MPSRRNGSPETPLLRVSRPVAACSRCRSAKIKCDGKLPACTACERSGKASSCSGANDEFAKGKERSYVAMLEASCERLEKRLAEVRAANISKPSGNDSEQNDAQYPSNSISNGHALQTGNGSKAQRKDASDIDDLVGDFGFLSVDSR